MKRFGQIILIILFLGIIFTIPILTKLQKNQTISQFENRRLAEAPVLTRESLLSGEYFSQWETYLSDHIFGRDHWIRSYTYMNMALLGKSNINDIVIGRDGFLLPFLEYGGRHDVMNSEENLNKMAEQIKELHDSLAREGKRFYFVGIPSQATYNRDKYPWYLQDSPSLSGMSEKLFFSKLDQMKVPYINMNEVFSKNKDVEYYYKTDHHYNFEGAYATYYAIIETIYRDTGFQILPPIEKEDMEIVTLPNPFAGSRNRQIYYMFPADEKIKLAYPKNQAAYEKYDNGRPEFKLYYISGDITSMINYNVYMGGDKAETVIKTNNDKLPNLLVFGDSFTNAIEPLLFNHFNETRILDLRHYNKMSLYEYIEEYKPDIVLMVRDDLNYGNFEGNGSFKGENVK